MRSFDCRIVLTRALVTSKAVIEIRFLLIIQQRLERARIDDFIPPPHTHLLEQWVRGLCSSGICITKQWIWGVSIVLISNTSQLDLKTVSIWY